MTSGKQYPEYYRHLQKLDVLLPGTRLPLTHLSTQ